MTPGKLAVATVSVALVLMSGTVEARGVPLMALDSTAFFSLAPCRVIDTRNPTDPLGGPALVAGADRAFPLANVCGIPSGATAVSVTIAVTGATAAGNLRLHAGGTAVPLVSAVNYSAGQTRSNNAVVPLNVAEELAAFVGAAAGTVHFILDVNGYFAPAAPVTIYDIKTGIVGPGSSVQVVNALVTAAKSGNGFFMQVKSGDTGFMGPDHSGLFVFSTAAAVSPGDRVSVSGVTQVFQGQIQIAANAPPVLTSSGEALPAPVSVAAPGDIANCGLLAGAYDGIIVNVTNLTVTAQNVPLGEFTVTGGLIVDDFLFAVSPLPTPGTVYSSLTGILATRQSASKLLPRDAADVVP